MKGIVMIKEGQLVNIGTQKFLVVSAGYYETKKIGEKPQAKNLVLIGVYDD